MLDARRRTADDMEQVRAALRAAQEALIAAEDGAERQRVAKEAGRLVARLGRLPLAQSRAEQGGR